MNRLEELKQAIAQLAPRDGVHATAIEGLTLARLTRPSEPMHGLQQPALCIIAQGKKRVISGDRVVTYDEAKFLVATVDTPVVGQVVEASEERPYLSLKLDLDPAEITALLIEAGGVRAEAVEAEASIATSAVTDQLLDAAIRLVRLLETPDDISVLAPMVKRELLYRVLRSDQGTKLQQIAIAESRLQQVNRAIGWIKSNYRETFAIEVGGGRGTHERIGPARAFQGCHGHEPAAVPEAAPLAGGPPADALRGGRRRHRRPPGWL